VLVEGAWPSLAGPGRAGRARPPVRPRPALAIEAIDHRARGVLADLARSLADLRAPGRSWPSTAAGSTTASV